MATKRPTSKTSGGEKPNAQKHAPLQNRGPHPTTHAAAEKRNDNQSYKL